MNKYFLADRDDELESNINVNYDDIDIIFKNKNDREIVLCVGEVQSGKTAKMFSCIERSFSDGYNLAILLTGNTNSLYNQTLSRFKKENKNKDYWVMDKDNINSRSYNPDLQNVVIAMKTTNSLSNVINYMYSIDNLSELKIIILDDESDYASVNINKEGKSETFRLIVELYKKVIFGKLLQITATPFANIISSNSNDLKAQRIICWSKPEDYTGHNKFMSLKNQVYLTVEGNKESPLMYKESVQETVKYFVAAIINKFNK
ncbi:MAG: DEAD/DEAH box helicase family protein, partial [Mycoplasma sp.]